MLVSAKQDEKKIQFRIRIENSVYKEIENYCQWANIQYKDYFIEKACQYIFINDEEWLGFKNAKPNEVI